MTFPFFRATLFALVAGTMGLCCALPARAAVSVLGLGDAARCYKAAEFADDARIGLTACEAALKDTALPLSDRAATFVNRGILKSLTGDLQSAIADYEASLRLDENLAEAYVNRGNALNSLKRYTEALADLTRAIELGAHRPAIAYYDRALVKEALGNLRGAYDDFRKALELEPDFKLADTQLQRFKLVRQPA